MKVDSWPQFPAGRPRDFSYLRQQARVMNRRARLPLDAGWQGRTAIVWRLFNACFFHRVSSCSCDAAAVKVQRVDVDARQNYWRRPKGLIVESKAPSAVTRCALRYLRGGTLVYAACRVTGTSSPSVGRRRRHGRELVIAASWMTAGAIIALSLSGLYTTRCGRMRHRAGREWTSGPSNLVPECRHTVHTFSPEADENPIYCLLLRMGQQ